MGILTALDGKTLLIIFHFIGLAFGAGGAWISDLIIIRFLQFEPISSEKLKLVHFLTNLVTIGLCILWMSGLGFIIHYSIFEPEKLLNPKIWSKVTIVVILSLNGYLLHRFILPILNKNEGKTLFHAITAKQKLIMTVIGTISLISWAFPVLLGASKGLNFTVSATEILTTYVLAIIVVSTVMYFLVKRFTRALPQESVIEAIQEIQESKQGPQS
ncbi:MAG: hypothetical protein HRU38_03490 [Saccharospirillaceae bacterium]|nr:hypothetical protein [Pseudomonadales bacterium]NRB77726.1 hypothetical protein [Saccharospirillaceae bacterium]